jgi:hypothetical protein
MDKLEEEGEKAGTGKGTKAYSRLFFGIACINFHVTHSSPAFPRLRLGDKIHEDMLVSLGELAVSFSMVISGDLR